LLRAIRKIPKEKSFDPLLGLVTTATPYKPGSQARFLVGKMAESEKNIQEVLTKLAAHLEAIERKVDLTTADLGKVREKVDLTMSSIASCRRSKFKSTRGCRPCRQRQGHVLVMASWGQHHPPP
jgi:hypothetical protein